MNFRKLSGFALAAAMTVSMSAGIASAQNDSGAKQDMKSAGHETKDAAVDAGHGIKQGTKKAYHKTKRGTKKAAHKVHNAVDPN
jgi:hypothetical protein